jgi:hypothetical protein
MNRPEDPNPEFQVIQLTARLAQEPAYRELPGTDGKHVTELRLAVKGMGSGDRDGRRLHQRGVLHHDREGRRHNRHRLAGRRRRSPGASDLGEGRPQVRQASDRGQPGRVPRRSSQRRHRAGHHRLRARRRPCLGRGYGAKAPTVGRLRPGCRAPRPCSACAPTSRAATQTRQAATPAAWPSRTAATSSPCSTTAATPPTATAPAFAFSPALTPRPAPRATGRPPKHATSRPPLLGALGLPPGVEVR